jgi:hypothetical protein
MKGPTNRGSTVETRFHVKGVGRTRHLPDILWIDGAMGKDPSRDVAE